ncbi:hypothetical protein ACFYMW_37885 [Streptomyces sp. NPDC006692]|uniref:hypothetical protein n=1 Tax=unclassified Streptomyces TaxID=2593676 RepID=UPI0036C9F3F5
MSEQYPYQQQPQYDQYGQPVQPQPPFPYEPYQDQPQYTQTWEGQTWDTQYQPTIPPAPQPGEPAESRGRHAQPWQEGAEHAPYLPPQNTAGGPPAHGGSGTASVPLPPEMPMPQTAAPYGASQGGAYGAAGQAGGSQGGAYGAAGQAAVPSRNPSYGSSGPVAAAAAGQAHGVADQPPAAGGTGYGSPTTVGNARITDAQRARAEGRSPIIAPGMRPASLTALLSLLLAVAAPMGPYALAVPLVLLQAVTAAGWFRLNGMWPARQGIALAFAGGLVADVALLALGREHAPAAILGTLGVWVLLTLVLQLRSHADPDERMYGLMATVASAALTILAGGYLAAPVHAVSVGAAAVGVAVLARALPLPSAASVAVALLAAAGVGIAVGGLTGIGASGALLGLAAAGCALIGLRVASYDYPSRFVHMTAGVALPLTAAVPVLYLIGRAVA